MEYLKLIGILIVILGFALKKDSILIIMCAFGAVHSCAAGVSGGTFGSGQGGDSGCRDRAGRGRRLLLYKG